MVREGRIQPDPAYHAGVHGIRFEEIVTALAWCFRVVKDRRSDASGEVLHPNGYVAWGQNWGGEKLRADFNLATGPDGRDSLSIVTAMRPEDR